MTPKEERERERERKKESEREREKERKKERERERERKKERKSERERENILTRGTKYTVPGGVRSPFSMPTRLTKRVKNIMIGKP